MTLRTNLLLSAIRNRGSVPSNEKRYKDDALILFANEELMSRLFPFINRFHEEFFLQSSLQPLSLYPSGYVPLPRRAFARALREIRYVDTAGNISNLPRINLTDMDLFPDTNSVMIGNSCPYGFDFYNDSVKLIGNLKNAIGSIELTWLNKPSTLVLPDTNDMIPAAPITAWATVSDNTQITADTSFVSSGFNASAGTRRFDLIRISTGALVKGDLVLTVAGAGTSTTFTDTLDQLDLTDFNGLQSVYEQELYLVPAGVTPFTLIPPECDPLLTLYVVSRYYEAQGYTEDYQIVQQQIAQEEKNLAGIYADRIQGEAKKMINRRGIGQIVFFSSKRRRW